MTICLQNQQDINGLKSNMAYRAIYWPTAHIGNNDSIELTSKGNIEQVYGAKYAPDEDTPLSHLEFSLKYDDLNLDFLKTVLGKIPVTEIIAFIEAAPSGKYARMIGFLYEFLTQQKLIINKPISGNYVDILDTDKYITGKTVKYARWRINNNLLGPAAYCPMVRKTNILTALLNQDISKQIQQLKNEFPPDIFRRATSYLYTKEIRSSYENSFVFFTTSVTTSIGISFVLSDYLVIFKGLA